MSKTEQTHRLKELLKPDVVIDLDRKVATPIDLLQIRAQLERLSSVSEIEAVVDRVIAAHSGPAQDYRDGKKKALGFLAGQVMRATRGKANPQMVNQLLREKLGG